MHIFTEYPKHLGPSKTFRIFATQCILWGPWGLGLFAMAWAVCQNSCRHLERVPMIAEAEKYMVAMTEIIALNLWLYLWMSWVTI